MKSCLKRFLPILLLGFMIPSVHFDAPPRFDETGYLILAKSLTDGRGYCEIDQPDAPGHAHFPPGWPVVLSIAWKIIPAGLMSPTHTAHTLSVTFWLISILLFIRWFRQVSPEFAAPLGLALTFNWLWIRVAGELRSESLFIALSAIVFVMMNPKKTSRPRSHNALLGMVIGLSILSRQVGVALAGAVFVEFVCRKEPRKAMASVVISALFVLPWVVWQWSVGGGTQAELLAKDGQSRGFIERLADQSIFYTRRLPDSLFGPYIETATIFMSSPAMALVATLIAAGFCMICIAGFITLAKSPLTRFSAIYFGISLSILIVWPFTEAGRFLIPLIPILSLAFTNGLVVLCRVFHDFGVAGFMTPGRLIWLIPGISMVFGIHTWQKNVRTSPMMLDRDFDQACVWIAQQVALTEVIASRHPGDVYWRSGHVGVTWPEQSTTEEVAEALAQKNVGFLLVDRGRFVGDNLPDWLAPASLNRRPDLFQPVLIEGLKESQTKVWKVLREDRSKPGSANHID
jgi:hypothetical protein